MKTVTIYTDGACSGNPGPGGWGAILMYGEYKKELSGGEAQIIRILRLSPRNELPQELLQTAWGGRISSPLCR